MEGVRKVDRSDERVSMGQFESSVFENEGLRNGDTVLHKDLVP